MEKAYDLIAGLLASKANERMIGFAGFTRQEATMGEEEGMMKAAAFDRPDGSGYLTLTFIQDRGQGPGALLAQVDQEACRALLGPNCEMVIDIPLDAFAAAPHYRVEELNIYFYRLKGQERALLEAGVLPALSQLLGLEFKPLQAWQPDARA